MIRQIYKLSCLFILMGIASGQSLETWTAIACDEASIPFSVCTPKPGDVYLLPTRAVIIEEVKCDGKLQQAHGGVHLHGPNFNVTRNTSKHLVYRFSLNDFVSIRFIDPETGEYNAELYEIPRGVRLIEIKYRIRFPDDKVSELQLLKAYMREPPIPVPPLPPRKINPASQP